MGKKSRSSGGCDVTCFLDRWAVGKRGTFFLIPGCCLCHSTFLSTLLLLRLFYMAPPDNDSQPLDTQINTVNGEHLGSVDLEEQHAERVSKYISQFDLVDIGARQEKTASDLKDVRNILVTGGAGFM
jgi:hypothetical protein